MNVSDVNQGVNMVLWWRVRLYLSHWFFSLTEVSGLFKPPTRFQCPMGGGSSRWSMQRGVQVCWNVAIVFGLSGLFCSRCCGWKKKQGGSWTRQVSVAPFKVRILWTFWTGKIGVVLRWWKDLVVVRAGFLFFAFAYTNMQNDFYELPNSPFAGSKIWTF